MTTSASLLLIESTSYTLLPSIIIIEVRPKKKRTWSLRASIRENCPPGDWFWTMPMVSTSFEGGGRWGGGAEGWLFFLFCYKIGIFFHTVNFCQLFWLAKFCDDLQICFLDGQTFAVCILGKVAPLRFPQIYTTIFSPHILDLYIYFIYIYIHIFLNIHITSYSVLQIFNSISR